MSLLICKVCAGWFEIDMVPHIEVESGHHCEYCADLTGRPAYNASEEDERKAL